MLLAGIGLGICGFVQLRRRGDPAWVAGMALGVSGMSLAVAIAANALFFALLDIPPSPGTG